MRVVKELLEHTCLGVDTRGLMVSKVWAEAYAVTWRHLKERFQVCGDWSDEKIRTEARYEADCAVKEFLA